MSTVDGRTPDRDEVLDREGIAKMLLCSPAHVSNLMTGKVSTRTPFPYFNVGRRKLSRRSWLLEWSEKERRG